MRVDFIKFVYNKFLNLLEDVELTAPSDGDILVNNGIIWENKSSDSITDRVLVGYKTYDVLTDCEGNILMES